MTKIKLVVDSGAGISDLLLKRFGISVVPLTVIFGDEPFLEGMKPAIEVVKAQERDETVTTSAPSIGDAMNALEKIILDGHNEIIVITLPKHSSRTYDSISKAAENLTREYQERHVRIEVVDGYNASMALGFLVLRVAELLEQGASYDETVDFVRSYRRNTLLLVALWEPKFAAKGGRVDKQLAAHAASLLRLHPTIVVAPNERARSFGRKLRLPPRKMNDACEIITQKAIKYWRDGARLAVVYVVDAKVRAERLRETLSTRLGIDLKEITLSEAPAALVAHAGHGAVAIAVDHGQPIRWD